MKRVITLYIFSILISLYSCNHKTYFNKIESLSVIPIDSSFDIVRIDSGHVAFPDIIKTLDNGLMVVYRHGNSHADSSGKIMYTTSSIDAKNWTHPKILINQPYIDERDPSISILNINNKQQICLNYFKYVKGDNINKPTIVHPFFAIFDNNLNLIKEIQIDKGDINPSKLKKDTVWKYNNNEPLINEAVSSPTISINGELIIPTYGGVMKYVNDSLNKKSRISLFYSNDNGNTWSRKTIKPDEKKNVNLQEPFILNFSDDIIILQARTMAKNKYSPEDKMMQCVSYNGGRSWTPWQPFNFIGHAPYLYKLSNGTIISAFRLLDSTYTLEGCAMMFSVDTAKTWSDLIIVDPPRKNNDSSYPSIVQLDDNKFLIVFYSDNGKAIKGRMYKILSK